VLATLSACTPGFGEITNNFDWIPATSTNANPAAPTIKFRIGAFPIALRTNFSIGSISAAECVPGARCKVFPVRVLADRLPVDIAACSDVVVEPTWNNCCNWRKSSANAAPVW
jgi:hypothetical protein